MINIRLVVLLLALPLSSCVSAKEKSDVAPVSVATQEENCTSVQTLVTSYENGFRDIRGTRTATKLMDIWHTEYQLVGKSCEIWGWGKGKIDYMCSKTFPAESIARERYREVKANLKSCLSGWQITERPRKLGDGMKAVFQKGSALPAVSLHIVNTKGVFKSEWTAYLFIGDKNEDL